MNHRTLDAFDGTEASRPPRRGSWEDYWSGAQTISAASFAAVTRVSSR